MNKKLFIGNISWGATQDDLKKLFEQAGTVVSAVIITDKFNGRSKGFGFVEMGSEDEAQKAIDSLNGAELDGRQLVVNEAKARE